MITLDGNAIDIDDVRSSQVFILVCDNLFSQTGLDPSADHTIHLKMNRMELMTMFLC
jgi:hypothetical protein